MAKELAGAVCVVTGGSSGIGRACARLLAARGAKVYVLARSKERLAAAVEEIEQAGGFAEALVADVASPEELAHAAAKVRAAGEGVDILVAGAGIDGPGPGRIRCRFHSTKR